MHTFFTIIFFILGASVGSFLSVLIHRTRHFEKGIVKGRSKCTNCEEVLSPKDLIPILSYLALGGKCRKCDKAISKHYFAIEIITAIFFAFLYTLHPFVITGTVHGIIENSSVEYSILWQLLYELVLATGLIAILFYDILYKEIPDIFSIPLIIIAIAGGLISGTPNIESMFLGLMIGIIFFGAQFVFSKGRWVGGGDIRLGAFMGILLGWQLLLLALFVSYIVGSIYSIGLLMLRLASRKSEIPFGPFLIFGSIVAYIFGPEILAWYLSMLGF